MKQKHVTKAVYTGEAADKAFIASCRIQLLKTLFKRGILTEKELEKGIAILKEPDR